MFYETSETLRMASPEKLSDELVSELVLFEWVGIGSRASSFASFTAFNQITSNKSVVYIILRLTFFKQTFIYVS